MVHLRIVAPADHAERALKLLLAANSVCNVASLKGAALQPEGDLILCDVAREDASILLHDLRELKIPEVGSVVVELIDTQLSAAATEAVRAASGSPSDAVVWEEVESRTSEEAELSLSFLLFMVLATLIGSVGIYLDTPILIVGAMVVGPEFGPIAGFCVAAIQRERGLAGRSLLAVVTGFTLAIAVALGVSALFRATGVTPEAFHPGAHTIGKMISNPDFFSFFVAFCAGIAGMLSLTTAKSGALIGVLISVTTIPSAACVAVSLAYGEGGAFRGALEQLGINIGSILVAGVLTLALQKVSYERRRRRHQGRSARHAAGLQTGSPRHEARAAGAVRGLNARSGGRGGRAARPS